MNTVTQRNVVEALRIEHGEIRAALDSASAEPGPIGSAAKRLARLCLPHFEHEERIVFPLFGQLNRVASEDVRPEMAALFPQINEFCAAHMGERHRSFDIAIEELLQLTRAEEGDRFAATAAMLHKLKRHERLEDELVYPAVILIGKYLHKSLAQPSVQTAPTAVRSETSEHALDAFLDKLVRGKQPVLRRRYSSARMLHVAH